MQWHRVTRALLVLLALIIGAIGCGDDDDDGDQTPIDAGTAGTGAAGNAAAGTGAAGTVADAGAFDAGTAGIPASGTGVAGSGSITGEDLGQLELTDGQIAAVMMVANQGEVEPGSLALQRATADDVREFADRMVQEHSTANVRLNDLLATTGIITMTNALSQQLMNEFIQMMSALQNSSDEEFDLLYMEGQRTMHERVLVVIDQALLPSVDDSALRSELETMRPAMAEHLEEAGDVLADLQESE